MHHRLDLSVHNVPWGFQFLLELERVWTIFPLLGYVNQGGSKDWALLPLRRELRNPEAMEIQGINEHHSRFRSHSWILKIRSRYL